MDNRRNSGGYGNKGSRAPYNNKGNFNNEPNPRSSNSDMLKEVPLPDDYVSEAERVIGIIAGMKRNEQISSSKLRNLYSLIINACNADHVNAGEKLSRKSVNMLMSARVRMVYECGRDANVKEFVSTAKLIGYMKAIGDSSEKLTAYANYMEALVAYHRFYKLGGER